MIKNCLRFLSKPVHSLVFNKKEPFPRRHEEKALRGQDVIICDDNDNIQRISAKELIAEATLEEH